MINAARAAVDVLAACGVQRFYTVPGESFLPVMEAVEGDPRTRLISTRHESGAAFMAEADAKVTAVPAVAMATRGVGGGNLSIGVHTAYQDSTPLIALLGQVETEFLHREAFQEVDLTAFFAPITKWAVTAHRADRLPELFRRAYEIAVSGRPGPVAIALPADLLDEDIASTDAGAGAPPPRPRPAPSVEEASDLSRRLQQAAAPVIIAGGGTRHATQELRAVAEAYSCGVYTTFRRQDVFPSDHPLHLGHLGINAGPLLAALEAADVVMVVGSRLSEITTQGYRLPRVEADVLHVDIDSNPSGHVLAPARKVVADAGQALHALLALAPAEPPQRDWRGAHETYLEASVIPSSRASQGVDPARVVGALQAHFPPDTVVTNDAGNFASFVHRHWRFSQPGSQVGPTSGAMGYAVPAAVGAKLADPARRVIATVGDGGFLMTGMEAETAVRCDAPITIVVFRNGLYGTIAMHQAMTGRRLAAVEINAVDVAALARSLGARALTVDRDEDIDEAAAAAAAAPGEVIVLEFLTDPDLISPTQRLSELGAPAGTATRSVSGTA